MDQRADPDRARPPGLSGRPGQVGRPRPRRPGGPAAPRRAGQEDRRSDPAAQARPRRPPVHRLRRACAHLRRHGPPARLYPPLTVTAPPSLHLPDEPTARAARWRAAIADGADLVTTLSAADGVAEW